VRTNKLLLKYIELSDQKEKLLTSISDLSKEELNFKPSDKVWSISQVIEHLIDSETGINKYVNYRLKNIAEQPSVGLRNFIKSKALNNKLQSDQKFKVPSVLSEPETGADYSQLKEKWDNSRMFLIKTVETYPKEYLNKAVFLHPRAGLLSMNQTLSFFINHLNHHVPQVQNLKALIDNKKRR